MRLSIPVILGALVLAAAASARAQECTEGRVVTPESAGRCCWPGQTFSAALGRCEGPPRCPDELVPEGDSCVERQLAADDQAAPTEAPAAPDAQLPPTVQRTPWGAALGPGPSTSGLLWPARPSLEGAVQDPRVVRGTDDGLVLAGLLIFGGGYLGAILIGVIDQTARNCADVSGGFFRSTGCDSWPLAFVPIGGGIAAGSAAFSGSRGSVALGIIGGPIAAVQILGMIFVGLALGNPTVDVVPSVDLGADARLSFMPHASSESAGLALTLEL